jgi:hypothetical protein
LAFASVKASAVLQTVGFTPAKFSTPVESGDIRKIFYKFYPQAD